jgi:hypothetical protein
MDWNKRVVVPAVAAFALASAGVILAILRLGGVIGWPSRWVAFAFLAIVLFPVALLLLSAFAEGERQNEPGLGSPLLDWLLHSLPWDSRRSRS